MTVFAVIVIFTSDAEQFALFNSKTDAEREVEILKEFGSVKDARMEKKKVY